MFQIIQFTFIFATNLGLAVYVTGMVIYLYYEQKLRNLESLYEAKIAYAKGKYLLEVTLCVRLVSVANGNVLLQWSLIELCSDSAMT